MKFLDVFSEIQKGDYALTEEAVYSSIQNNDEMIPLWGGNKEHKTLERMVSITTKTTRGNPITIFTGEGIIISLDGSAGSMTYKKNEKFALNHHAGYFSLKDETERIVDLEYFATFFQNFYRALGVSEASKTLSLQQIYAEEFELPSFCVQIEVMKRIRSLTSKITMLDSLKTRLNDLLSRELTEYK